MSRWWYLDLAAEFPELEIYHSHGWGPAQELGLAELGDRVMTEEALWLPTLFYSTARDRHWAATIRMFAMVIQAMRDRGLDPEHDPVPDGWHPDAQAWDARRVCPPEY